MKCPKHGVDGCVQTAHCISNLQSIKTEPPKAQTYEELDAFSKDELSKLLMAKDANLWNSSLSKEALIELLGGVKL